MNDGGRNCFVGNRGTVGPLLSVFGKGEIESKRRNACRCK